MTKYKNQGFALIAFIIVMVIIAILAGIYFSKPNGKPNVIQTGNNAIEQTKKNNAIQNDQQLEIQKNLGNQRNKTLLKQLDLL